MTKTPQEMQELTDKSEPITKKSGAQIYIERGDWVMPADPGLRAPHALTCRPLWEEVMRVTWESVRAGTAHHDCHVDLARCWPFYVELLSM